MLLLRAAQMPVQPCVSRRGPCPRPEPHGLGGSDGGRIGHPGERTLRSMVDDDNQLGDFIRARRDRLRPDGPDDEPRRVPGLRREELALLAGISTNYLVRLEQGRDRHPSPSVLDALASALQLDDAAAAHLHTLGRPAFERPRARKRPADERVSPSVAGLLGLWVAQPVIVNGRWGDVLASTPLAVALSPCFAPGRNGARDTFLDPALRELFGDDWDRVARSVVAGLRALSATDADEPRLTSLIGELSVKSVEFRRLWARHDVRPRAGSGTSRMTHPQVGPLELTWDKLAVTGAPGQQIVVYHAEPGSSSERALTLLGGLVAEGDAEARSRRAPLAPPHY